MSVNLYHGDCLEVIKDIPSNSIDMILCDLPYGVTQCEWDSVLPLDKLWLEYKRIIKQDRMIVLTSVQPFTSLLVTSNLPWFKYDWIWKKPKGTGHLNVKKQPMKDKEDILVFASGKPRYFPQMLSGLPYKSRPGKRKEQDCYGEHKEIRNDNNGFRHPKQVLEFPIVERNRRHPTQKPVELLKFLIKTYSLPGEIVLDNCMGSGSTGDACINTDRNFIGIEQNEVFFNQTKEYLNSFLKNENV